MQPAIRIVFAVMLGLGLAQAASAATQVCSSKYSTRDDWATGFVADGTLENTGSASVKNWQITWQYAQPVKLVGKPWGASVVIDGNKVLITPATAPGTLAAARPLSFGMALAFEGSKPATPTQSVEGDACRIPEVFYVNPASNAANWVNAHPTDGRTDAIRSAISSKPTALWFGDWNTDVRTAVDQYVTAAGNQTPVVVAYNLPHRDCGQYSKGGAASGAAYQQWITGFIDGIGSRKAVMILEPDGLAQMDCLSSADQTQREQLMQYATTYAHQHASQTRVYVDIGHSGWLDSAEAARRLAAAGVAQARGFSLNVSNYGTTGANEAYGKLVAAALLKQGASATFVIDTSRNGNGPLGTQWCDVAGRKLGTPATEYPDNDGLEMTLWVKPPGNADGCAAAAGTFSPDLAYKLVYGY